MVNFVQKIESRRWLLGKAIAFDNSFIFGMGVAVAVAIAVVAAVAVAIVFDVAVLLLLALVLVLFHTIPVYSNKRVDQQ